MKNNIVVLGSYVADLMGRASHLPQPGETALGSYFKIGAGGKGYNQGIAAFKSGGAVSLVTRIGKDHFGDIALDGMRDINMPTEDVIISDTEESGAALILVDENTAENEILVIPGASGAFTKEDIDNCKPLLENAEYMLTQLEINLDAIYAGLKLAKNAGATTVLNPAPVSLMEEGLMEFVDIITPNEVEAKLITGIDVETVEGQKQAANYFHDRGVKCVVITLGKQGVFVSYDDISEVIPAFSVKAVDTTGAGDAFNGAFVTALSEKKSVLEAAKFGCAVAALSVQKMGTSPSMPSRGEVDEFLQK